MRYSIPDPENEDHARAEPWPREGGALATRGRSPGHARAEPWPREGGALVFQDNLINVVAVVIVIVVD
jgi:hypothetical protein